MSLTRSRRDFATALGATALAWPISALPRDNTRKMPRVGVLWQPGSAEDEGANYKAMTEGFKDLGWGPVVPEEDVRKLFKAFGPGHGVPINNGAATSKSVVSELATLRKEALESMSQF